MIHDRCPSSEVLSDHLDGKLDSAQRGAMEDHISRCEECYFAVKETALLQAALPDSAPTPAGAGPRGRAWTFQRLLPLAAVLVVAAGSVAVWRLVGGADPYARSIKPLVEGVGERRFFEPRLTGGFKYGPVASSMRAPATGPSSESWAMMAAAAEMRQRLAPGSPAARASRAAAALFLGEVDLAVSEYARLVEENGQDARWSSDLAAALLVRASSAEGSGVDGSEALRFAENALRLDPTMAEAAFNRAFALDALGRKDEARRAFSALLERGGSWAPAARDALRDLELGEGRRP